MGMRPTRKEFLSQKGRAAALDGVVITNKTTTRFKTQERERGIEIFF